MATMTPEKFRRQSIAAAAYLSRPLRLKEIPLPEGDVGSINIGRPNNGAQIRLDPDACLAEGYDGFRLVGKGIGRTQLRCTSWDGVTVAVRRFNGVVQLEGLSYFAGKSRAIDFGEQNFDGQRRADGSLILGTQRITCPKFQLRLYEVAGAVPDPAELGGVRATWLNMLYNADEHYRDTTLDATQAMQHIRYRHGPAYRGSLVERGTFVGSAGEEWKDRGDITETAWAGPNVWTLIKRCAFQLWGMPHGDYSTGAAIVQQNGCSHGLVEDTVFRGRDQHPGCIMLSANSDSYDMETGQVDKGFGNGVWVVRRCGLTGANEAGFWNNQIVNVYRHSGPPMAAMGFSLEDSGAYGKNSALGLNAMPRGSVFVVRCNTPTLKAIAEGQGFNTQHETVIPTSTRLVPVSEGYRK
jgi:hypothetical protein